MLLKILSLIGLAGSILWVIAKPDYDSSLAVVSAIAAVITSFVIPRPKKITPNQNQIVGENGFGIQAGNNVTIGSIEQNPEAK